MMNNYPAKLSGWKMFSIRGNKGQESLVGENSVEETLLGKALVGNSLAEETLAEET